MFKSTIVRGRKIAFVLGLFVLAIGLLAIAGWQWDVTLLKAVLPDFVSMKFNTALGLIAFAIVLMGLSFTNKKPWKYLWILLTIFGFLLGLSALAEYIFSWNLRIDEFFVLDHDRLGPIYPPGRLAPATAVAFLLVGLAIWFSYFVQRPRYRLGQIFLMITAIVCFQALLAYFFGIQNHFGSPAHTRMALNTAIAIIFLCVGFMCLMMFRGYMVILLSKGSSGSVARTLVLAAMILPPVIDLAERFGEDGSSYGQGLGSLLRVIAGIAFLVLIVWWNSEKLHHSERKQKRVALSFSKQQSERAHFLNEQKMALAVKRSEAHLRAVVDSSFTGIVCIRESGEIYEWNRRVESIFGWSKAEVLGKDFVTLIAPLELSKKYNEELQFILQKGFARAGDRPFEMQVVRKDGDKLPIHIFVSSIEVDTEVTYTIFIQDISERRLIESELIKARERAIDSAQFKSKFLANMSHEIRTPLNGIIGMAKLLSRTELNAQQNDLVETINISSNTLLTLVNQVLDLSKIESGRFQLEEAHFEMRSLIQSSVAIVNSNAQLKGLSILTEIAEDVPNFLLGDSLRLRQILLNLLNNAVKFTDKGAVRIRVGKIIGNEKENDSVSALLFEVIDEGIGMDTSTQEKIFQSFSQGDGSTSRKYGGTGLGLSISKQLVEMMGGRIGVESEKDKGSRFFFEVSLNHSKLHASEKSPSPAHPLPTKIKAHILIAEDNLINQKVMREMVILLGCTARIANNGLEAIEALKHEDFDLILMDGQMPSMDGYEASSQIRKGAAGVKNKDIPIIATTANAIGGDIEKCFQAGMSDYISKPVILDNLTQKIEKSIQRGRALINISALEKLQGLAAEANKNLIQELVEIFASDAPKAMNKMRMAIRSSDFTEMGKVAHGLKSACASLGIFRMQDLSERIEKAQKDPQPENLLILLDLLEQELLPTISELNRYT